MAYREAAKKRLDELSTEAAKHAFEELHERIQTQIGDLDAPLLIMVVGEGKFGKSTLLNNLAGAPVAETGRVPKTWRVDLYRDCGASEEHAILLYRGGREVKTSLANAQETCREAEKSAKATGDTDLVQVTWLRKMIWPDGSAQLVDTPGFSQFHTTASARLASLYGSDGIRLRVQEAFDRYYFRADVVLWCIRGDKLEDQDTLEKLIYAKQDGRPVIGILTFMDQVPADSWTRVQERATALFGEYVDEFVPHGTKVNHAADMVVGIRQRLQDNHVAKAELRRREHVQAFVAASERQLAEWLNHIGHTVLRNSVTCYETVSQIRRMAEQQERAAERQADTAVEAAMKAMRTEISRAWAKSSQDERTFRAYIGSIVKQSSLNAKLADVAENCVNVMYSSARNHLGVIELESVDLSLHGSTTTTFVPAAHKDTLAQASLGPQFFLVLPPLPRTGAQIAKELGFSATGFLAGVFDMINAPRREKAAVEAADNALHTWSNRVRTQILEAIKRECQSIVGAAGDSVEKLFLRQHGRPLSQAYDWLLNIDHSLRVLGPSFGPFESVTAPPQVTNGSGQVWWAFSFAGSVAGREMGVYRQWLDICRHEWTDLLTREVHEALDKQWKEDFLDRVAHEAATHARRTIGRAVESTATVHCEGASLFNQKRRDEVIERVLARLDTAVASQALGTQKPMQTPNGQTLAVVWSQSRLVVQNNLDKLGKSFANRASFSETPDEPLSCFGCGCVSLIVIAVILLTFILLVSILSGSGKAGALIIPIVVAIVGIAGYVSYKRQTNRRIFEAHVEARGAEEAAQGAEDFLKEVPSVVFRTLRKRINM